MPTLQVVSLDSSWQGMSGEGVGLLIWIAQDTELHGSEGLSCLKFVFLMGRGEGCGSGERDTGKGLKIVYPSVSSKVFCNQGLSILYSFSTMTKDGEK